MNFIFKNDDAQREFDQLMTGASSLPNEDRCTCGSNVTPLTREVSTVTGKTISDKPIDSEQTMLTRARTMNIMRIMFNNSAGRAAL
jgi:hypothetical protein